MEYSDHENVVNILKYNNLGKFYLGKFLNIQIFEHQNGNDSNVNELLKRIQSVRVFRLMIPKYNNLGSIFYLSKFLNIQNFEHQNDSNA